ncbi:hypothetical protein VOLCADRAFT_119952, partial [Volvox carteri f. nagariensis]
VYKELISIRDEQFGVSGTGPGGLSGGTITVPLAQARKEVTRVLQSHLQIMSAGVSVFHACQESLQIADGDFQLEAYGVIGYTQLRLARPQKKLATAVPDGGLGASADAGERSDRDKEWAALTTWLRMNLHQPRTAKREVLFLGRHNEDRGWHFFLNPALLWDDVSQETKMRLRTLPRETELAFARKYPGKPCRDWVKKTQKYRPPGCPVTYAVPLADMPVHLMDSALVVYMALCVVIFRFSNRNYYYGGFSAGAAAWRLKKQNAAEAGSWPDEYGRERMNIFALFEGD